MLQGTFERCNVDEYMFNIQRFELFQGHQLEGFGSDSSLLPLGRLAFPQVDIFSLSENYILLISLGLISVFFCLLFPGWRWPVGLEGSRVKKAEGQEGQKRMGGTLKIGGGKEEEGGGRFQECWGGKGGSRGGRRWGEEGSPAANSLTRSLGRINRIGLKSLFGNTDGICCVKIKYYSLFLF